MRKIVMISLIILSMQLWGQLDQTDVPFLQPIQGVYPVMTEVFCVASNNIPNLGSNNSTLLQGQVYPQPQYLAAQYVPGQLDNGVQVVFYSNGLTPSTVCSTIHPELEVQFVGVQPLAQLPNKTVQSGIVS